MCSAALARPGTPALAPAVGLTAYLGACGSRNERAAPGVAVLAQALGLRWAVNPHGVGDVALPISGDWSLQHVHALHDLALLRSRVASVVDAGGVPVTVNPRCAASVGSAPPVGQAREDSVLVWFDAHGDLLTPTTTSSGYLGGMPLAGVLGLWETGLGAGYSAERTIVVGARDLEPAEQDLLHALGGPTLVPPGPDLAARLQDAVAGRAAYLHLDCDVLAPGIIDTEYQSPQGLSLAELHACAAVLADGLVGLEIAEFQCAGLLPAEQDRRAAVALLVALDPLWRELEARRRVFHLTTAEHWAAAEPTGRYEWSTVATTLAEEGFIHTSTMAQLDGTYRRYYAQLGEPLVALEIDLDALDGTEVRWDQSGRGVFPHLYGPLPVGAVVAARPYSR